ncbi:MAG TPA: cation transporter [Dehalococcoidia bacterium]|nr:cation transporter [Dehalococcoidia bacterium]
MVVEAVVALVSGIVAHSVALEAFGLDSVLELMSAGVVLWWLLLASSGSDPEHTEHAGELAERAVGLGLLGVSLYVIAGAAYQLVLRVQPQPSTPGLIVAALAVVVMPVLFLLKRRNAERLGSEAMRGDAYESLACGWMALTLLVGLALRRFLGWWWADPITGLALVPFLIREGWEGVQEWFERDRESTRRPEQGSP